MSHEVEFEYVQIAPAGMPHLVCACLMPKGWLRPQLPAEPPEFDKPTYFMPLMVVMAPYGAVVFSLAARPAYDSGTVFQWMQWLASENSVTVEKCGEARVNDMPCLRVEASQATEAGPMRIRTLLIEDGGRLFNVSVMAPQQIWPSVEPVLERLLASLRLAQVSGPTVQIGAQPFGELEPRPEAGKPAAPAGQAVPATQSATAGQATPAAQAPPRGQSAPAGKSDASDKPTNPADVALAGDASSLDAENELNRRLRDDSVGLVPRIVEVCESGKYATVAAGAIVATFRVPFGWHVIDDGKRTLVFDAGNRMQINLSLRHCRPDGHAALLEEILGEIQSASPELQHMKLDLGGMKCLSIRNLVIEGERLQQGYLVKDVGRPDLTLVCRVTANDNDMTFAMDTAEVVLTSLQAG